MGKLSPTPVASTAPRRKSLGWSASLCIVGLAGFASLASYQLVGSLVPFDLHAWRLKHGHHHHHEHHGHHGHHHEPDSIYGNFPKTDDPFSFLPCTNTTIPPALEDQDHKASWARLFDSDPSHWNWGNKTTTESASDHDDDDDAYAGRGIYLCGYIDVPLDYLNSSDSRTVRLAVTKFQVSGLARTDGSSPAGAGIKSERTLVIEPGGPGGSGTSMVWRSSEDLTKRLTEGTYDTLGWDPRGVNTSQPAISCFPFDADRDRWHMLTGLYREESSDPETLLRWADAMHNATMQACWKRFGDLGRYMTTALVARDLEEIRKALEESLLTGYFVSYGTGIGQTWANMFPDSVGRLIMDGTEYVRDHRLLGGFGWTALDNGTNAWHDGFLGECINAGPEHCALAKPHGGKSVTLESLEKRVRSTIDSLITHPVSGYTETSGPSLVTYRAIVDAIYATMYNAQGWPALAQMLYELELGNSTLATIFLEKMSWEFDPTLPQPSASRPQSDELGSLVICADGYDAPMPPGGLAWWSSLWQNMTTKSWVAGNARFSSVFPCRHFTTYWPDVAEVYRGDLNHTLANPVLLIAETYDPATPLRNGRRLLAEMGKNARLIAHHGYGHSSRDRSNCTDSIARAYLLNGTLPDEQETACYADEKPYLYGVGKKETAAEKALLEDPVAIWEEHIEVLRTWHPWLLR
ncbi:hypothetical protein N0V93_001171 [Gnomoniopsis smithogilvyi]|uniref:Uncharacterized protein n=1 Tax=Gnomoniopsis smithogilvyi TaxID=1191159 RepID=A0A9W9D1E7_9PEZI|nr:hypothetical protein N0V93_001171 [Gnomoniopsis smithogilvyi]